MCTDGTGFSPSIEEQFSPAWGREKLLLPWVVTVKERRVKKRRVGVGILITGNLEGAESKMTDVKRVSRFDSDPRGFLLLPT
jgi:hypothetical protein